MASPTNPSPETSSPTLSAKPERKPQNSTVPHPGCLPRLKWLQYIHRIFFQVWVVVNFHNTDHSPIYVINTKGTPGKATTANHQHPSASTSISHEQLPPTPWFLPNAPGDRCTPASTRATPFFPGKRVRADFRQSQSAIAPPP